MKALFCIGIGMFAGGALAHQARPTTVPPLLARSLMSFRRHRFYGVRVVEFRRGPRISKLTEYITRDGSNTRIEYPTESPLSGQIITETLTERRHYFPDQNEIRVLPPRQEDAFMRLAKMVQSRSRKVKIIATQGDVIAGQRTEQMVVSDEAGNVLQRIYIEPQNAFVMKRSLFDPVGTRIGGYEYTEIDFHPKIDRKVFTINRKGATVVTPRQLVLRIAQQRGFLPTMLPESEGHRLEYASVKQIEGEDTFIQNYLVEDGRLSLFQLQRIVGAEQLGRVAKGRANFVFWVNQGRTFVLVGTRGVSELKEIAQKVASGTVSTGR